MKYLIAVDFSDNAYDAFEEGNTRGLIIIPLLHIISPTYSETSIPIPILKHNHIIHITLTNAYHPLFMREFPFTIPCAGLKAIDKDKDEIVILSVVEHTKLWVGILECNAALVEKAKKVLRTISNREQEY